MPVTIQTADIPITEEINILKTDPNSFSVCKTLKNKGWLIRYIASPIANGGKIKAEIDIPRSVFLIIPICSIKQSAKLRILFRHAEGSISLDISWKELPILLPHNLASLMYGRHENP